MENLTLGNFQQRVESLLRETVREHLKSMYPSPVEILETIDDIGLDWTDDGGECLVSFHNLEGFTILKSEFSAPEGERVLPDLRGLHSFGNYLDEKIYSGFYKISLSHPELKRGHQYWSEIISKIIGRLQNEYGVQWNYSGESFWDKMKFGIGTVTYISNTSSGGVGVSMPIDRLPLEISKVAGLEFRIKVFKKS